MASKRFQVLVQRPVQETGPLLLAEAPQFSMTFLFIYQIHVDMLFNHLLTFLICSNSVNCSSRFVLRKWASSINKLIFNIMTSNNILQTTVNLEAQPTKFLVNQSFSCKH